MKRRITSFRAQTDTEVSVRTETYLGRDWTVVPVVALVEGVLKGLNASVPELALAEEFGHHVAGWNGRPLVMNHPILNEKAVSANSPAVLANYAFGQIFNTTVADGKLKCEAWIDNERVSALGGEFQSTLDRINAGQTVEVSTGLFSDIEEKQGIFNGREYGAIWHNITPDHLAFLSEGLRGACSVEDGCGTPRVNAATTSFMQWPEFRTFDCGCGCGGNCQGAKNMAAKNNPKTNTTTTSSTDASQQTVEGNEDANEIVSDVEEIADQASQGKKKKEPMPKGYIRGNVFHSNAMPTELLDRDVRQLLCDALEAQAEASGKAAYIYVVGFTPTHVVYEGYSAPDYEYATWQQTYTLTDGVVTLGGDPQEVNLMTEIVPVADDVNDNQENGKMTEKVKPNAAEPKTDPAKTNSAEQPAAEVTANANKTNEQPKLKTQQDYLNEMPAEMREVMQEGLRLQTEKKEGLIKSLKDTGRCKFSDDSLKAMGIQQLEQLCELAAVPQDFSGRATIRTQASDPQQQVPKPIPTFPMPKAATA